MCHRMTLTPAQAKALESALDFYGSRGLFVHNHEKRLAGYHGEEAPLDDFTVDDLAFALFCGYVVK